MMKRIPIRPVVVLLTILFSVTTSSYALSREDIIKGLRDGDPDLVRELCSALDIFSVHCPDPNAGLRMAKNFLGSVRSRDASVVQSPRGVHPIILVPGFGGSAIKATVQRTNVPAWYCFKNWPEWFRLWLSLEELIVQPCWFDNMHVIYNVTNDDFHNVAGVETRAIDWGGLNGIDYLDYIFGLPVPFTGYFYTFISAFRAIGYKDSVTLFGAPYDWRVPTTDHEMNELKLYTRLRELVETAYERSGGLSVNLITHSMGGPTVLRFLNLQKAEWRSRYIDNFIPIAGPWAGSAKALRAVISGDNFGIEILGVNLINLADVRKFARQAGGVIYLIPDEHFYPPQQIFVEVRNPTTHLVTKYTARDFSKLFNDMGSSVTADIWDHTHEIMDQMLPPQVSTHCIYGWGIPTEYMYNYTKGFNNQPVIYSENLGDGTVPIESLRKCKHWQDKQAAPVVIKEFDLRDHTGILDDDEVFNYIANVIAS